LYTAQKLLRHLLENFIYHVMVFNDHQEEVSIFDGHTEIAERSDGTSKSSIPVERTAYVPDPAAILGGVPGLHDYLHEVGMSRIHSLVGLLKALE
jgi:hypothetical protein